MISPPSSNLSSPSASNSALPQQVHDELAQARVEMAALREENHAMRKQLKQLVVVDNKLTAYQSQLDSQLRIYRKLYELGNALNQTLNRSEVLTRVTQFVIYELGYERCLIFLFNAEEERFKIVEFDGYYEPEVAQQVETVAMAITAPLIQSLWNLSSDINSASCQRDSATDYVVCLETEEQSALAEWKLSLCLDEYLAFPLCQDSDAPLGLLIAGNSAAMFPYQTRVSGEEDSVLGVANVASQLAIALNSLNLYQILNEERAQLEENVQARTQDLHIQNESLQVALKTLKQTQAQLVQSEKMSGLGHLVAGLAHEINNPVSFIYGNLQHAQRYIDDLLEITAAYQSHYPEPSASIQSLLEDFDIDFLSEDLPALTQSMKAGATRIKDIVLSLRTFSRMDESEAKSVNIHSGLDATLMVIEHKLKGSAKSLPITVTKHYGNLPLLHCYPGQLNQVFLNILLNAAEVLVGIGSDFNAGLDTGADNVGTGRAEAGNFTPEIRITTTVDAVEDAECVCIQIADNGPGLGKAIIDKIFDPFFTTKPVGEGNGLGLSISYQIVCDRHQGKLVCASPPGQGTTFSIYLPILPFGNVDRSFQAELEQAEPGRAESE
ncbi:MAG: sensor histidine kinase [Phormidesmis sp.]